MGKYNPNIHHRRSIRLKGYDYSQAGAYFITICCQNRACLFGDIAVGANPCGRPEMILNDAGKMIATQWLALTDRFTNIELHEFIVMPNHFHGILQIVGASLVDAQNNDTNAQNNDTNAQNNDTNGQNNDTNGQNNDTNGQNDDTNGQPQGIAPTDATDIKNKTVGDMMDAFKSITTVEYIRGVKNLNWQPFDGKLWQRNYHEHIIRNEQSYETISNYIINNPEKWNDDKFYNQ